jgi:hypothetical protein
MVEASVLRAAMAKPMTGGVGVLPQRRLFLTFCEADAPVAGVVVKAAVRSLATVAVLSR